MNKKSTQRELVTRKRFNTSVDKDLLTRLDQLSEDTLIPKSKLIDSALILLFEKYKDVLHIQVMRGDEVISNIVKRLDWFLVFTYFNI